uniref:ACB domain-containing protein n=1 Tax=Acrobeloides nanus TaxID=290746 RepID=A0A914DBB1_9BILA
MSDSDSSDELDILKNDFDPTRLDPSNLPTELRKIWVKWRLEDKERQHKALEKEALWQRRKEEDEKLWRDRDFANAVHKMSLAGYKGEHGNFTVPEESKLHLHALYMQVTLGDYDENSHLNCAEVWKTFIGKTKIEAQREFIRLANQLLTKYGWNPPSGWR